MSAAARVHFGLLTGPRCGIRNWMAITGTEANVTCKRCLDLLNGTYHVGTRRIDVKPCGTPAAYRRHLRRGEPADETCLQGQRRISADRYQARKGLAA